MSDSIDEATKTGAVVEKFGGNVGDLTTGNIASITAFNAITKNLAGSEFAKAFELYVSKLPEGLRHLSRIQTIGDNYDKILQQTLNLLPRTEEFARVLKL